MAVFFSKVLCLLSAFAGEVTEAQISPAASQSLAVLPSQGGTYNTRLQLLNINRRNQALAYQAQMQAMQNQSFVQQPQPQDALLPLLVTMAAAGSSTSRDTAPTYISPDGVDYREETGYERSPITDFEERLDLRTTYQREIKGQYRIKAAGVDEAFHFCAKETGLGVCEYKSKGIMGDSAHRARRSCHNVGEAIDIGPLVCNKGQGEFKVTPKSQDFRKMIDCLANNEQLEGRFKVLTSVMAARGRIMYDQKLNHLNHMHVQLKCCNMVYGNMVNYPPVRRPSACN